MPSRWQTFPVLFDGGLDTVAPLVQEGVGRTGNARRLVNLEPRIESGFGIISGFSKFDDTPVPPYGRPKVQGAGQSGTTLNVADLGADIETGSTFTVTGVTGTYTVSGSVYSANGRSATLTITPALDSSPADKAVVTFTSTDGPRIEGTVLLTDGSVVVKRGGAIWSSAGVGWTFRSVPNYGTVLVKGAGQSGTNLIVDGISAGQFEPGDTFTINGVTLVYTVVSATAVVSGESTLTITPALASSPADNAPLTLLSAGVYTGSGKMYGAVFNFGLNCQAVLADGTNKPFFIDCDTKAFKWLHSAPDEVEGATRVAVVRNNLFFAKASFVSFTAPATESDFDTANGAGVFNVGDRIETIIPFKDNLIIFSKNRIRILGGTSQADFELRSLTDRIGTIDGDSVAEIGGDILYLSADGLTLLSDTERSGDFGLQKASEQIRNALSVFVRQNTSFQSLIIREKNQYRIFGFKESLEQDVSEGFGGLQSADQGSSGFKWFRIAGMKVFAADSKLYSNGELVVFCNETPYIYRMESGRTFDGSPIRWSYSSPWFSFSDTTKRKILYRANFYLKLVGLFNSELNVYRDFNETGSIQPTTISFGTDGNSVAVYGDPASVYGVSLYGGRNKVHFSVPTVGHGEVFSVVLRGEESPTEFTLETLMLEFSEQGRR